MAARKRATATADDPEARLSEFIDKFEPADQTLIRAVRKVVRGWMPSAHELVYDNYNFFVIAYSPTERPSDAVISIAARASAVSLCFLHGAKLPDPHGLLHGEGKQTRFLRVPTAKELGRKEIRALVDQAIARARVPMPATGKGPLVIRSVSAKQRPRRKP